jgi:hypothetical protein
MSVVLASGVAARAPVLHPGMRTNNYYLAATVLPSTAVAAISANSIYYQPISITGTVNRIGIEITTGSAGAARLGLYTNNNGIPGTLILDCGTVDTTNIAIVEATIDAMVLRGEWVWMAVVSNATPACRCGAVGTAMVAGSSTPGGGIRGYVGTLAYAALPVAAPAITSVSSVVPAIWLRAV